MIQIFILYSCNYILQGNNAKRQRTDTSIDINMRYGGEHMNTGLNLDVRNGRKIDMKDAKIDGNEEDDNDDDVDWEEDDES